MFQFHLFLMKLYFRDRKELNYAYNINNSPNSTKIKKISFNSLSKNFYEDLINEIINKTNNIPIKYDLYISTNTIEKKKVIEEYVKKHSNANFYEVMVIKNKGRDMLPLLYQFKNRIQYYKYLLGTSELISEILHIFEENEKIGFIYPEIFYRSTRLPFILNKNNTDYLNYFLNKMFPGTKVGKEFKFPLGNMFWARIDAIQQAFSHKFVYLLAK